MESMRQSWRNKIREYYSGSLYDQRKSLLLWLFEKVLSRVKMAEEYAEDLKNLSQKGIVIYALKNKSQLNSLILWNLSKREDISRPVYCHGISMILWQPFAVPSRFFCPAFFITLTNGRF